MMHDKDQSGSIDMDECMEILFRRFGKEQIEARVNEFMSNDEDACMEILYRRLSIYIATRLCLRRRIQLSGRRRHMVGV